MESKEPNAEVKRGFGRLEKIGFASSRVWKCEGNLLSIDKAEVLIVDVMQ